MNPPQHDKQHDADYERFVEEMAKHCHCASGHKPCDGVLAGGICDGIGDREELCDDDRVSLAYEEDAADPHGLGGI